MSSVELRIAFWTLIISSIFNLITIVCNIFWNSLAKKEKKRLENYLNTRDTIIRYYLPIKYTLLKLELCLKRIKDSNEKFDVFSIYSQDSELKKVRNEVISEYKEYIEEYNKLEIRYANSIIDQDLDRVYVHIIFILTIKDEAFLKKNKNKYELPSISKIIDEIDRYSHNNKVF